MIENNGKILLQASDVFHELKALLNLPDMAYRKIVVTVEIGQLVLVQTETIAEKK